ncbi:Eukaryotic translation initiation factor 4B1 [Dichanthelium oligosanthes]|uniref:Eukaryotic translation initiation factor 4B1 n=1 Tax=Dichanthelium oligosanthes TaxID=888268 RepID=A0A1E5WL17_9POAL|nr:Eukaryotic translation initiation factor 4B1 [Dichanthelium oligosanthes]
MSNPWGNLGGAGAWALDAERAEEEEREAAAGFPSLREAAAGAGAGGKSKKKNKGTTLSLSEFAGFGPGRRQTTAPPPEPRGLSPAEMMMLPTGPRERSADELDRPRGLGGGFRSYGGGPGDRGGFDDDGRRGPRADLDMPSRADEDRDWSMSKKSLAPSPADSGPRSRYGALGGGAPTSVGRADDDGDWSRGKKPMPSGPSRYPSLGSVGGGGFRDSPVSTDSSDRWSRAAPAPTNGERERPRLVLDPPKRDASATPTPPAEAGRSRPSPFGAARPREDVLADKGLDWKKMETEIDQKKTSRPTSSQSSRPESAHSSRPGSPGSQVSAAGSEGVLRARPKVNPFGDAKPREVILQEKGKDWRKIDLELEHRRIDRPETNDERVLKEEINLLKLELNENEAKMSDDDAKSLAEKITQMEKQLELLTIAMDDKVRFSQRPGSGAGRVTASPPTNSADESQIKESMERPGSRSGMDHYPKPTEEIWGFQGSRDRVSFGGNRSSDRYVHFLTSCT